MDDFNGVGANFARCTVLPEVKMVDKKSEASEKQDAHARKVYMNLVFELNQVCCNVCGLSGVSVTKTELHNR